MRLSHVVINVLRKPILSGPLESDIGPVRHMSEIATENKVYCFFLSRMTEITIIRIVRVPAFDAKNSQDMVKYTSNQAG